MTPRKPKPAPAAVDVDAPRRIEMVRLDQLARAPRNPKAHDLPLIGRSIDHFGVVELPTVDDRTGRLVAGHGRLDALIAAHTAGQTPPDGVTLDPGDGMWLVPTVAGWRSRSDDDAGTYVITSNQATILGGWDQDQLVPMLDDLAATSVDLLNLAGFTPADLEELKAQAAHVDATAARTPPDEIPPTPSDPISRTGDLWQLGPHRLICGDATAPDTWAALLDAERAGMIFTSPPYNVGVEYSTHDDRTITWADYRRQLLEPVATQSAANLGPGRALCWNIGTSPRTHFARQIVLLEDLGLTYVRALVWQKMGVPVPLFHNTTADPVARQFTPNYTHELVLVYARGTYDPATPADPARALAAWPLPRPLTPDERHELVVVMANGPRLKKGKPVAFADTLANDVFTVNQAAGTRDLEAGPTHTGAKSNLDRRAYKAHPATFPVALPEAFIAHLADVGDTVVDPFCGAGSTILAAWRTGRRGYGIELDPGYVDVACRRIQAHTGLTPTCARLGPVDFTAHAP